MAPCEGGEATRVLRLSLNPEGSYHILFSLSRLFLDKNKPRGLPGAKILVDFRLLGQLVNFGLAHFNPRATPALNRFRDML